MEKCKWIVKKTREEKKSVNDLHIFDSWVDCEEEKIGSGKWYCARFAVDPSAQSQQGG